MKRFLALVVLVIVGVGAWQVGAKLSADAIGMGVGVVFGVLAGIPTALLLLASNRRNDAARTDYDAPPPPRYQQQPPVIVFAAPHQTQPEYNPYGGGQGYAPALPDASYQPQITDRSSSVIHRDWAEVDDW